MTRRLGLSFLLLIFAASPVPAVKAGATTAHYSIQVRAVPLAEREDGMATYRQLRDKGYLVYAYRAEIDGAPWLRIAVGAFGSHGAAAEFGRAFGAAENMDHFVARAPVRILPGAGERDFVVTPSALWVRGGDGAREVFAFAAEAPNGAGLPTDILPEPSPGGEAIAFVYDSRLYTATLDGGAVALTEPGAPTVSTDTDYLWRPRWSPSGRHVAFLDQAFWEYPIGLWVARADGGGLRCLACNRGGQSAVRWFVWHPAEDRLFFVEGFAYGSVAVGGDLLSADMGGAISPVAAAVRGEREEIAGPLTVEDGHLHFQRVRFNAEYDDRTFTPDRLPIDAL